MDKQQKLKIVLPVLLVVMAFVWGPIFIGSDSKGQDNNSSPNGGSVFSGSAGDSSLIALSRGGQRQKAKTSYSDWGRNPFLLGYDSKALVVEGIVWDEKNPKAIINGDIIGVGDEIGPNTVVTITQNSVVIRNEGSVVELYLGEEKSE